MRNKHKKKVALITGGTNGIGSEIAKTFLNNDYKVLITGTNKKKIDLINSKKNSDFRALQSDFKDNISLKKLIQKLNRINKIDVLVNNAGINKIDNFVKTKTLA